MPMDLHGCCRMAAMRRQWEQSVPFRLETRPSLRDWWPWMMKSIHCECRHLRVMQTARARQRVGHPLLGELSRVLLISGDLKSSLAAPDAAAKLYSESTWQHHCSQEVP